jgi:hypothetical protein
VDDIPRSGTFWDFNQDGIRPCGMSHMELRLKVEIPGDSKADQQEE